MSQTQLNEQQEIARLRQALKDRLSVAPRWLANASVQKVRDWKTAHEKAQKTLSKKSPTANELHSAIQSVN